MFVFSIVPLTTVAPFAGLTIVFSLLLAQSGLITLRETLQRGDVGGAVLVVVGVMLVSVFGPHHTETASDDSLHQVGDDALHHVLGIWRSAPRMQLSIEDEHGALRRALGTLTSVRFVVFATLGLLTVVAWLAVLKSESLRRNEVILGWPTLVTTISAYSAAVCGTLSQSFLKVVAVALRISLQDPSVTTSPWRQPAMWGALIGLLVCAPTQLYLLDVTLASGSVAFAVPVYQVMLISLEVGAGAIFFLEFAQMRPLGLLGFAAGVLIAAIGLVLLSQHSGSAQPKPETRPLKGDAQPYGTRLPT